jgi:hypothetical protein
MKAISTRWILAIFILTSLGVAKEDDKLICIVLGTKFYQSDFGIADISSKSGQQTLAYYVTNRIMDAIENDFIENNGEKFRDSILLDPSLANTRCRMIEYIHKKYGGETGYSKIWGCQNQQFPFHAYAVWMREQERAGKFKISYSALKEHIWFYKKK